jgi:uncharacterized protein (DUF58 family)
MDREIFDKVRRIEIRTSRLVNDAMGGEYHSVFKGRGMEFDEVREYRYGDDVRSIDWNVTARLGQLHIKRYVEERELTVMLLVDLSASKNFGSSCRLKNDLAAELAAVLAFSAIRNQDRVGAAIFTGRVEKFIPPRKGRTHVLRLIREILAYEPSCERTSIEAALRYLNNVVRKHCVVFLISDFIDEGYEKALRAVNSRHDLVAIPVGDRRELDLPASGILQLLDPESGQIFFVDTWQKGVVEKIRNLGVNRISARNLFFKKNGIDYLEVFTHKAYEVDLIRFFRQRALRMR